MIYTFNGIKSLNKEVNVFQGDLYQHSSSIKYEMSSSLFVLVKQNMRRVTQMASFLSKSIT